MEGPVLPQLVTLAVLSQFGEDIDPQAALSARYGSPEGYLGDLDDYRKAIAVSMLAKMRVDANVVKAVAGSFITKTKPLDLRTRAWLAKSLADLDAPRDSQLVAANIEVSDPDIVALNQRPDGILESGEISYSELRDLGVTVQKVGGPEARGFLRIEGRLVDGQDLALPQSNLRRRYFRALNGQEIDPTKDLLAVGDKLVVVVEATADAFESFTDADTSDIGPTYGPLVVEALLPSALSLVSEDLSGIKLKGDLAKVVLAGNLRSVTSHPQGWRAIIVPQSTDGVVAHDQSAPGGGGEVEEDGQPSDAPPLAPAEPGIEFRQAMVVSVVSAGSYLFPATTIDPLDFPGNTLLSQSEKLEVTAPRAPQ
jgi:hypothetical protein